MPHISSKKLNEKIFLSIHKELIKYVSGSKLSKRAKIFNSLLTETEKIMLAKRLATILLLSKGHSYYAIEKLLNISSSTVARFDRELDQGKYKSITSIADTKSQTRQKSLLDLVAHLIHPMSYLNPKFRWSILDDD